MKTKTTTREVHFGRNRGFQLTKRFSGRGLDKIIVRPFGKDVSFSLPVTCIDQVIESLLDLKVLMKDVHDYNSGFLRAALVDGSGREVAVSDLTDTGRQTALYQVKALIEEIEEVDDEEGETRND